MNIYIIDHPSMNEDRKKEYKRFSYKCGRKNLLLRSATFKNINFFYVYTDKTNKNHEYEIVKKYNPISVISTNLNILRDFTGYLWAVEHARNNRVDEILLVNSSCSVEAMDSIMNAIVPKNSILSAGCKGFARYSNFKLKLRQHIQTYCMRINSHQSIEELNTYLLKLHKMAEQDPKKVTKDWLIINGEVGLTGYMLSKGIKVIFYDAYKSLKLLKWHHSVDLPFFDSRKKDIRFTN